MSFHATSGLPEASAGQNVSLAQLTTLHLGGPSSQLHVASTREQLIELAGDRSRLLIGGGSNLVISDEPLERETVAIRTQGILHRAGATDEDRNCAYLTVAAGEPWDAVVARAVSDGLSGLECLSGIPGAAGATPIQNVGAYGSEVCETITEVEVLDRDTQTVGVLTNAELRFSYRHSILKANDRFVVLGVTFRLHRGGGNLPLSVPIKYAELASKLDVKPGERAPLNDVRHAVLELRKAKGMVLDPTDPDTVSAGSFFTNPILSSEQFENLKESAATVAPGQQLPMYEAPNGHWKTSAAWLIERAGFQRGHSNAGAAISSKHTLALTNRGGSTAQLLELAQEIALGVQQKFGVWLVPEPVFIGCDWPS